MPTGEECEALINLPKLYPKSNVEMPGNCTESGQGMEEGSKGDRESGNKDKD